MSRPAFTAVNETDVALDGGILHVYDSGPDDAALVVLWHHGTPNIGAPPRPLFQLSEELGVRWVSWDRPGYGGSTPTPGRGVRSAARHAVAVTEALGIDRFGVMGHSGGAPHALASAALLPGRVLAAVSIAGLAPYGAQGLDWFGGMAPAGVGSLRAATQGRAVKETYEASGESADMGLTPADENALGDDWSWVLDVVRPAVAAGPGGLVDDDLAYVAPWGFDVAGVRAPVLLVHGEQDKVVPCAHGQWLAEQCPTAELWLCPSDGHVSVLRTAPEALRWLTAHAGRT
jgi:pimeloyl-ACP methyl ester carboxylesterase